MSDLGFPGSVGGHRLLTDALSSAAPLVASSPAAPLVASSPAATGTEENPDSPPVEEFLDCHEEFEAAPPEPGEAQIYRRPPLPDHEIISRIVGGLWDLEQLAATIGAICRSLHAPQARVALFDSDDEGRNRRRRDPTIAELDAGSFRLIDTESLLRLHELLCPLPQAARLEALRKVSPRILDVIQNEWILRADLAIAVSCEEPKVLPHKLKITTKLLCVMWQQLHNCNCQPCQEVRNEYFAEVAGPCINKLLDIASSFSSAEWTADHAVHMLPIFDSLADALCSIQGISFTRSNFISQKVADIFCTMCEVYRRILNEIEYEHRRKEADTHPATDFFLGVLEFFSHYRDFVEPNDYKYIFHSWVSKIEQDAETLFKNENGRQFIFILSNIWSVWKKRKLLPIDELMEGLQSLRQNYMESYLCEWAPLLKYLQGDFLSKPRRTSLVIFAVELGRMCDRQMNWEIETELKWILRESIRELIVQPYEQFLMALETAPSSTCFSVKQLKLYLLYSGKKGRDIYTIAQVESILGALFESSSRGRLKCNQC